MQENLFMTEYIMHFALNIYTFYLCRVTFSRSHLLFQCVDHRPRYGAVRMFIQCNYAGNFDPQAEVPIDTYPALSLDLS